MGRTPDPWYWAKRDQWMVTIDGKRHKLAVGKPNKADATKVFHQLMANRSAISTTTKEEIRLDIMLAHFLARAKRDLKETSAASYEQHLQMFSNMFGSMKAVDVRPFHVSKWVDGQTWGPSTKARAITTVKTAYSWAHKQGLIDTNPVKLVEKPQAKTRTEIITEAQAQQIVDAIPSTDPFRLFILAIWDTGARPSEVRAVTAADVDWQNNRWKLTVHKSDRSGRPRMIYLTPRVAEFCKSLCQRYPKGPIFRNRDRRPWTRNAIVQRFEGLRSRLGYGKQSELGEGREITAYSFRHLFITRALLNGVSISDVAELVGHVDTKMIMRVYSHLREHAQHLQGALSKTSPTPESIVELPAPLALPAPSASSSAL